MTNHFSAVMGVAARLTEELNKFISSRIQKNKDSRAQGPQVFGECNFRSSLDREPSKLTPIDLKQMDSAEAMPLNVGVQRHLSRGGPEPYLVHHNMPDLDASKSRSPGRDQPDLKHQS